MLTDSRDGSRGRCVFRASGVAMMVVVVREGERRRPATVKR
jgi:hypothetical protein